MKRSVSVLVIISVLCFPLFVIAQSYDEYGRQKINFNDDPCATGSVSYKAISLTANTELVAGSANKHVYICSLAVVVGAATDVAFVSGTGTVCATSIAGIIGGSTAATGFKFAANGGIAYGNGNRSIARTNDAGDALCILVSAANQTSGVMTYVQK